MVSMEKGRQVRLLCPWARHLTGLLLPLSGDTLGRRQRGAGEVRGPYWIFIHDTDIAEESLMVLIFGLFSVSS